MNGLLISLIDAWLYVIAAALAIGEWRAWRRRWWRQ